MPLNRKPELAENSDPGSWDGIFTALDAAQLPENFSREKLREAFRVQSITREESQRRREAMEHAIRMNQTEGLEPTPRLLALVERYVAGEITLEEYGAIVDGWD